MSLPSKEMLLALPLLLVVRESMQPFEWDLSNMVLLALPLWLYAAALLIVLQMLTPVCGLTFFVSVGISPGTGPKLCGGRGCDRRCRGH